MNNEGDRPLRNWNTAMIVASLSFISAGVSAYVTLSNTDVGFDQRQAALEKRVDRLDNDVRYRLDKIDEKMDKLLERRGQ